MFVKNNGSMPLHNVPIDISINGKTIMQELIGTINPGENLLFNSTIQLSTDKSTINISLDSNESIPDIDRSNNSFTLIITHEKEDKNLYYPSILIILLGLVALILFAHGMRRKQRSANF
jgi:hypothetical protein